MAGIDERLTPILGEFAWHALTVDPTIDDVSAAHYEIVAQVLKRHLAQPERTIHVLEVAAYAHTTGYELNSRSGAAVELFDISPSTLKLGRVLAERKGLPTAGTRRTAGDFHELPYEDAQFDFVYVCSALHHAWRWRQALSEMIRVLIPGGVLFLENEPCKREFCFNLFRTNRMESFTDFERRLDHLGILRVVAEAHPGSRPETLFGMVENQSIPLRELLGLVGAHCVVLENTLQPEICMGPLENELVGRRDTGAAAIETWLLQILTEKTREAATALTSRERGLGFSLPSNEAIRSLAANAARQVADLPHSSQGPEFNAALSNIFGASVRTVARKRGRPNAVPRARLKRSYPTHDGITLAFPAEIARLLSPGGNMAPDIQTADLTALLEAFPASDWTATVMLDNIRTLVPRVPTPSVLLPVHQPGIVLLLARVYTAFRGQPYRVVISRGQAKLTSAAVYQVDSHLLAGAITCPASGTARLSVAVEAIENDEISPDSIGIHYLGAFMV